VKEYNEVQKQTIKLLELAEHEENLKKWVKGRIPKHYKRISVSEQEGLQMARLGAKKALGFFNARLYYTQALLLGAVLGGKYKDIIVVTPSQYGKSWLCGMASLLLANDGRKAYVAAGSQKMTSIILGKVIDHIQDADYSLKSKILETADKIEKLQSATSKNKVALRGGGLVTGMSLGETFSKQLKGNDAIGIGGDIFADEASLIGNDAYAELGRSEFASESGEKFIRFRISNPHNPGRFWDDLTAEEIAKDTLIVWMDARTALEEGRIKSKEQVVSSEFFKNKSTCKRYLLCELEDYSEQSLFTTPVIDDSPIDTENYKFFLGVDSAYKGKDDIRLVLSALTPRKTVRMLDYIVVDKKNWVDGQTGDEIVRDIGKIINAYNISSTCVDIGYGVYVVEGLAKQYKGIKGIAFGGGVTEFRKKAGHYAAKWGDNKRAEMHLDLQDLMENSKITFTSKIAEVLKEEMNAVRGVRKTNGKIAIIPKDDIKRIIGHSPDTLDATILSLHALLIGTMKQTTPYYT